MMTVAFTAEARQDLREIALWIAKRNPAAAFAYVDEIEKRAESIALLPHAGAPRPKWGKDVRFVTHGTHLIVHRAREETVHVLRVVHGARDLDRLFREEPLPE